MFYIIGFAFLPIIILLKDYIDALIQVGDAVVTLGAFLVILLVKNEYRKKSEKETEQMIKKIQKLTLED